MHAIFEHVSTSSTEHVIIDERYVSVSYKVTQRPKSDKGVSTFYYIPSLQLQFLNFTLTSFKNVQSRPIGPSPTTKMHKYTVLITGNLALQTYHSSPTLLSVPGANTGFGFAIATALSSSPRYHIIMAVRSLARGQTAFDKLHASHAHTAPESRATISLLHLDPTDCDSISSAASYLTQNVGRLDALINNAGLLSRLPTLHAQLIETFSLNTFAPALLTESLLPLMERSPDPRVIHISADLGSITLKSDPASQYHEIDHMAYRMSKAALNMMTACHAVQFHGWGGKVWSYNPGFVVTDAWGNSEEAREAMRKAGAGSADDAAQGVMDILEGGRDDETGCFLDRHGRHPW
ncbi:NAD(P)-binding protein [Aspergillus brunneoviolaceus CBS 621.78]|uniref:NAD(P)-binding protein n=1 Tax=Aspergillus brunneoviolaceus CBS 621.78 TaxID=1450534 RepID=A0ACD1GK43_9EURO|nr:NAD(P)-binding protein [Aspergillus brunneoviolaceus CBS 621.78]RAH49598.1 NAD(P)-binding protein [Aspergillus brunneoviolaceus CBS 621.78]